MIPTLLAQTTQTLSGSIPWLPPQASTVGPNVDWILDFVTIITVFFTVLILALMVYFCVRYRHKPGGKPTPSAGHSTALELTWTIIPTILVVVIFFYGFREYLNMVVVPPNTYEVRARGFMWGWDFAYPNGYSSNELHVPEGVPVRVVLTSDDVIHALYIPALRLQKMNVPGRYNRLWFQAQFVNKAASEQPTADGKPYTEQHMIYCNMYCGTSHSEMLAKLVVHRKADFLPWLEDVSTPTVDPGFNPVKFGEGLRVAKGCASCHSVDGSGNTGPTWKNLYGHKGEFTDGKSYVADEAYIRESILYPGVHIVKGYGNAMPAYAGQLKDYEIDSIIAYLKSISTNFDGGADNAALQFKFAPGTKLPGGKVAGPEGEPFKPNPESKPK